MAAGLGFKDFVTGEVLTAADVDGYLMQGVWVFADATARDAAVTSPQEGNFAYLKDTDVTTYYTGSAWTNLDTTGMVNPMTTTGDTIYSSSGSTPARLGIGSTGQVLTVSGGVPSWATPSSGSLTLTQISTGSFPASTELSITGLTQDYLFLYIFNPKWDTANGTMHMLFNSDTGANYNSMTMQYQTNIDTYSGSGLNKVELMPNSSQYNGNGRQYWIEIKNAKNAGFHTWSMFGNTINTSGTQQGIGGSGIYTSATALTSIQIKQSDGYNFNSGTYTLWGA